MHPVLATPVSQLQPEYDVIVVGSGYGGAVAASRLARSGLSVAILERGRLMAPSDMPRTPLEVARATTVRSRMGTVGAADGLLRYEVGDKTVGVGVGVGGGSLINSAVYRRPDPRVFDDPAWPTRLRGHADELDAWFDLVGEWLEIGTFAGREALPRTPWFEAMSGDRPLEPLMLGVASHSRTNRHGVYQPGCHACGECNVGCHTGAKSSLDRNYIPDALAHGASLFTGMEVQHVSRSSDGQGWVVTVQATSLHRDAFCDDALTLSAARVVLAAGTVGSTGILQRSAKAGLPLSAKLGHHFSANGCYLAFVDGLEGETAMQGQGRHGHADGRTGPSITQAVTLPGATWEEDVLVEDGAHPSFVEGVWPSVVASLGRTGLARAEAAVQASVTDLRHTANLLCMGHDGAIGTLEATDGDPVVRWPQGPRDAFRKRMDAALQPLAERVGGRYAPLGDDVTVHPLGGCVMADSAASGVVDHTGAVFAGATGTDVHEGLFVVDASVIPRALGCNPSWTIAALAERAVAHMVAAEGTYDTTPLLRRCSLHAPATEVRFTERMAGWLSLDGTDDPDRGAARARARREAASFVVTIAYDDPQAVGADPTAPARVVGTARIAALSDAPITILGGTFQLFVPSDTAIDQWVMRYELPLHGTSIPGLRLEGDKHLSPGSPLDGLRQTTTLSVRLMSSDGPVGAGRLTISARDLLRQLSTMRGTGAGWATGTRHLSGFLQTFGRQLRRAWLRPIEERTSAQADAPIARLRPLDAPEPTCFPLRARDGRRLLLERYAGGDRGPVMLVGGYAMTSEVFTLETVSRNLVETLCAEGYDVWVLLWRSSPSVPASRTAFTLDDVAAHDHPAAIDLIREVTGAPQVHAVAHCLGAVSLTMGQLSGAVDGLGSMVLLQAAAHMELPRLTHLKMSTRLPTLLDLAGVQGLPADAYQDDALPLRLADQVLRAWPQVRGGRCRSASCRRTSFLYGDLWNHDRISPQTHDRLPFLVGHTAVRPFRQLARIGRAGRVVDARGRDLYEEGRHRLDLPITFLWSEQSGVFGPGATRRTHDDLVDAFGPDAYRWVSLPGYGHLDSLVGTDASEDVFPHILAHLERWTSEASQDRAVAGSSRGRACLPQYGLASPAA